MICTTEDDFVVSQKEGHTRWVVQLSSGETVYMDDGRPGVKGPAWLRLKSYCAEHGVWITSMYLQFRSHIEHVPPNRDGYFFARGIRGYYSGENLHFFLSGYVEDGILYVTKWQAPELLHQGTSIRDIDKYQTNIIMK